MADHDPVSCPALLIAGCASGQGKTTVTAALARHHRRAGRRVRVFKTGPDFIDPMVLEAASGEPVYNIDCWMVGVDDSRALLAAAAEEADLLLVEGAMGLYDGEPSAADLAATFGVPVAAVIDAGAMAQTFGAIALGLQSYRPVPFAGVIANRVASAGHARMLAASLPADIALLAALPRAAHGFPERHLGIVQAEELADLPARLDALADLVEASGYTALPPAVRFVTCDRRKPVRLLAGRRIAVARDAAFSFLYRANLDCLAAMGAECAFFSPLADEALPEADALYLPGGYPELHLGKLQDNRAMREAIRAHHAYGKPIVAECGGMLYLLESLADKDGNRAAMAGLLPGHAVMQEKLANLGLHSVALPEGTVRGHTFHYSQMESSLAPIAVSESARGRRGEPVYRLGRLHASYLHMYFPSNPEATAHLFAP